MINATDTIRQSRAFGAKRYLSIQPVERRKDAAHANEDLQQAHRERLKELKCLYGISRLVDSHENSLEPILQGIVEVLPPSWQYPGVCCARLTILGEDYATTDFRRTAWRQSAEIRVNGELAGTVEVCYLREVPEADEGPFLCEERELLAAVAERVGKIVERIQVQRQLASDRAALEESNAALRRVLAQFETQKNEIHDSIAANVNKVLMPVLCELESKLPGQQKPRVALFRKHLNDLVSPFANRLSNAVFSLTPIEIDICNMIRDGLTTKQIAQIRHVALKTVGKQRERIRKKLQITDPNINLTTHLKMLASD